MADSVGAAANANASAPARPRRFAIARALASDQALFAVATVLAWTHTIDELRIGEVVAFPFAVVNAALVAMWSRFGTRSQAAISIFAGLFWALTVIPYHVVPLLHGAATWQNVSGLTRLLAGVAMIALGVRIALRGRRPS
jgi:hypothetical protein